MSPAQAGLLFQPTTPALSAISNMPSKAPAAAIDIGRAARNLPGRLISDRDHQTPVSFPSPIPRGSAVLTKVSAQGGSLPIQPHGGITINAADES
jgi:hypothetical protein